MTSMATGAGGPMARGWRRNSAWDLSTSPAKHRLACVHGLQARRWTLGPWGSPECGLDGGRRGRDGRRRRGAGGAEAERTQRALGCAANLRLAALQSINQYSTPPRNQTRKLKVGNRITFLSLGRQRTIQSNFGALSSKKWKFWSPRSPILLVASGPAPIGLELWPPCGRTRTRRRDDKAERGCRP